MTSIFDKVAGSISLKLISVMDIFVKSLENLWNKNFSESVCVISLAFQHHSHK